MFNFLRTRLSTMSKFKIELNFKLNFQKVED